MLNQNSVILFGKLPAGALFKVLKPETIHSLATRKEKVVNSTGSYVKICDAYSINIFDHKDAIFLKSMPCRLVPKPQNFDKLLPAMSDWAMVNRNRPETRV